MEAAPRSWQFSLSNWPVTRKVSIVLVLPVLLASTFAVLRINAELHTISELSAGAEQADVIHRTVAFASATAQLGVAATAAWGDPTPDPNTDSATARFDQAVADLETSLRATKADPKFTEELSSAIAVARTMRNGLRGGSVATIGEQADEVAVRLNNAISLSPSVGDTFTQRIFLQVRAIMHAHRLLTQQRMIIIGTTDAARNPSTRARVLPSIGAEMTMIRVYVSTLPESASNSGTLFDAAQSRLATFMQNTADPTTNPSVLDSLRTSTTIYEQTTTELVDTIDRKLATQTRDARNNVLRDTAIVIGALLAGLAIALMVARSLVVPVRRLRRDALQVAHVDLPDELEVVRSGGVTPDITPVDVHTTEEIGQLARAVDDIHQQALHLAGEQARLRMQIGNMFETLSRRSQSLVEQQLTLIEELEREEDDSERLQSLFRLDHLATRMRRNGDNLLVLAGTALRRGQLPPVPLSDMLWSAVSQVEDYQRVEIGTVPDGIVAGESAVDIEHMLAELIDNALRYSPPNTPVAVSVARAVDGGYLIEITDRGLGMSGEDLQAINERLASGGEVTVETARRMGLFVVGRLAKRHTITVSLRRTSTMAQQPGITVSVHLPGTLVTPVADQPTGSQPITAVHPLPSGSQLEPTAPPERVLVPVPNPPAIPEVPRFGVTSAGLPQRRPLAQVLESPEESEPSTPPALLTPAAENTEKRSGTSDFDTSLIPVPTVAETTSPNLAALPTPETTPTHHTPDSVERQRIDIWAEVDTYSPEPAETLDDPVPTGVHPAALAPPRLSAPASPSPGPRLVTAASPTPIYQRMVSEWLVEPASARPGTSTWTSSADAGWAAAEDASNPTTSSRTEGGLPIRRPGAQLVPGGLTPTEEVGTPNPDEIRNSLTRHLSGVRSGRADAQHNDGGRA